MVRAFWKLKVRELFSSHLSSLGDPGSMQALLRVMYPGLILFRYLHCNIFFGGGVEGEGVRG